MGLLFVYILKSSACLAVFYLFYRLLLSRETFHRFNRFALLGILLLSCLLPLIKVSVQQETEVHETMLTLEQLLMMADMMEEAESVGTMQETTRVWMRIIVLGYLAGILFFALRTVYSLVRLMILLKSGKKENLGSYLPDREEYIRLIVHQRDIAPFSWMKFIVISRKDLEENGREILIHELAHIRNRHSLDLMVADICIFLQWFNPASWLLKQELQNIHEYEADETVIEEGVDAKQYQLLLIKKAVGTRLYSMANSFNHSKLKKRITMMLKEKSSPWARLKYLYVLPVAAVAVTAFARPEISEKMEDISAVKVNDLAEIVETKPVESVRDTAKPAEVKYIPVAVSTQLRGVPALEVGEKMPEFPGSIPALMEYFNKNMRYPESAEKKGLQGRVTVQFLVDKDGSIKDPKVLHSIDKELDAEALRLISSMPKWEPGRRNGEAVAMKFTVPVMFRPNDERTGPADAVGGDQEALTLVGEITGTPLYIIDGKEVSASVMRAIRPQSIAHISVLKDKSATDIYGEKGKNGVIVITLKNEDTPYAVSVSEKKTTFSGVMANNADVKEIFVDGVALDLEGKPLNEVISIDDIDNIMVNKASDGRKQIYITIKKRENAAGTSAPGTMSVKGKILDEQGKPVVGAIVVIEGTKRGTVTDTKGEFLLSTPNKDAVLVISYVGMATEKVKVQAELTVTLKNE